jgi:acetyltransferase-like isoleucine patch superfamily enzyme
LPRFFTLLHFWTENEQPTANSQQPTANSQQPTANSQQPTANNTFVISILDYLTHSYPAVEIPLMIYGTGEAAQKLAHALIERKYKVCGFLGGKYQMDGIVFRLENWLEKNDPAQFILIVAVDDAEEMVDLPILEDSLQNRGFMVVINIAQIHATYPVCSESLMKWYRMCRFRHALLKAMPYASIGTGTYCNGVNVMTYDDHLSRLRIGNWSSVATGTCILLAHGHHRKDWISVYPWDVFPGRDSIEHTPPGATVDIGSDAWIGQNVIILPGMTIGNGAVIGAGAVVSRDVEPYSIVVGNPARHIRYRFPENIRQALLEIRWWDWPVKELMEINHLVFSDRVGEFLRYARKR